MAELHAAPRNQSDCDNLEVNVFLYSKGLDWIVSRILGIYSSLLPPDILEGLTERSKDWTEGGQ